MKELVIPVKKENKIEISEIDIWFKGLIIAYKDEKPVGYFQNDYDGGWYFMIGTNNDDIRKEIEGYSLLETIQDGIRKGIFNKCKVIEFGN